jgi:hypothetical protein
MQTFSRNDVVLIRYPFSDLSQFKVRPAVIVGQDRESPDLFIVPLTSRLSPCEHKEACRREEKAIAGEGFDLLRPQDDLKQGYAQLIGEIPRSRACT